MNKKDIVFFNKKLKYTFHKSTPTTQFVQRVQLSSEETVQWHKLWQLPDTNLPRQLQYINVFHQRKNKLWETLSQVLFVESNHLNYPQKCHRTVLPGCNSCRRHKTVQVQPQGLVTIQVNILSMYKHIQGRTSFLPPKISWPPLDYLLWRRSGRFCQEFARVENNMDPMWK